ncbi:helix-turn-helix domain-containing protein [Hyphomicrobium sp. LHD-15]|uniref:helix-turn-helix transcriptional regulator n=1 Tax=Hyphomicrobium sp. LHD-15 TaxID=3072142 RepID=UPI00280E6BE5|nr:helix-turn-helix domain-containing protein [Hyphomicrobium sp. LHD-15]MDQ8699262.1 helix-turn-helix domain-containing protein [Hyphomicrobium sp. LHD-15]
MNPTTSPEGVGPDLLTTREAAALLRLSVPTLERFRLAGNGPIFIKLGAGKRARVVYRRTDLETWLDGRSRNSTSEGQ